MLNFLHTVREYSSNFSNSSSPTMERISKIREQRTKGHLQYASYHAPTPTSRSYDNCSSIRIDARLLSPSRGRICVEVVEGRWALIGRWGVGPRGSRPVGWQWGPRAFEGSPRNLGLVGRRLGRFGSIEEAARAARFDIGWNTYCLHKQWTGEVKHLC